MIVYVALFTTGHWSKVQPCIYPGELITVSTVPASLTAGETVIEKWKHYWHRLKAVTPSESGNFIQSGTYHCATCQIEATVSSASLIQFSRVWEVWWVAAYVTDCWLWESFTVSRNKQSVTLGLLHTLIQLAHGQKRRTVLSIKNLPTLPHWNHSTWLQHGYPTLVRPFLQK